MAADPMPTAAPVQTDFPADLRAAVARSFLSCCAAETGAFAPVTGVLLSFLLMVLPAMP